MIDTAIDRGYRSLFLGNLNDSLPLESNSYDAALCVGVFTHGHVGPSRLIELIRVIKPQGLLCFTVNEDVYESYGCLLYTSPSPRDRTRSRMPSSA